MHTDLGFSVFKCVVFSVWNVDADPTAYDDRPMMMMMIHVFMHMYIYV